MEMSFRKNRIKLVISYDGTNYKGWQKQPDNPSVQECIEKALSEILQSPISLMGSGRTDAGVHAQAQVAHFDSPKDLGRYDLLRALNSYLPTDISILDILSAPDSFHALESCEKKSYCYRLLHHRVPCALRSRYTLFYPQELNLENLQKQASVFLGEHDFEAFQNEGTPVYTTVRKIFQSEWRVCGDEVEYWVEGSGFLKQMVRNLVGAMLRWQNENEAE